MTGDFIDRLAARVVGTEPSLAPRLPAWFEPAQRAPIMPPPTDVMDPPVPDAERSFTPLPRDPTRSSAPTATQPAAATVAAMADRTPAAHAAQPVAAAPSGASHRMVGEVEAALAPIVVGASSMPPPYSSQTVEPIAVVPLSRPSPHAPNPDRLASQATSIAPALVRPAAAPLLPARRPGQTTDTSQRASRAQGQPPHADAVPSGGSARMTEPAIHVSIGRLEVRAAPPASALPPRRREPAAPSRLDDYLRQRGDRVPR